MGKKKLKQKCYFRTLATFYIFCQKLSDKCVGSLKSDKESSHGANSLSASLMTFSLICIQIVSLTWLAASVVLKLGACPEHTVSVVFVYSVNYGVNLYVPKFDQDFKLKEFK